VDAAKIVSYDAATSHVSTKAPQPTSAAPAPRPSAPAATAPRDTSPHLATPEGYVLLQLADLSNQQLLHDIKQVLGASAGQTETYIVVGSDSPKKIRLPFRVKVSDQLMEELRAIVGSEHVSHSQ